MYNAIARAVFGEDKQPLISKEEMEKFKRRQAGNLRQFAQQAQQFPQRLQEFGMKYAPESTQIATQAMEKLGRFATRPPGAMGRFDPGSLYGAMQQDPTSGGLDVALDMTPGIVGMTDELGDVARGVFRKKTGLPILDAYIENKPFKGAGGYKTVPEYLEKYKGRMGKVLNLSPDEFLERAVKMSDNYNSVDDIVKRSNPERIEQFAEAMKGGTKFNMPYLSDVDGFSQEGFHRVLAAKKLGVEKIPALIERPSDIARKGLGDLAQEVDSAEEFVEYADREIKDEILKPINDNVDDINVRFETTCINCEGGSEFVNSQMAKAVEVSKTGEWADKIKGNWADRLKDYDTSLYLNDEYLIFQESGIENFYKLEDAPQVDIKSQLTDIYNQAKKLSK